MPTILHSREDRPVLLPNALCPYCHKGLTRQSRTKEHVIGRRFVPKGSLDRCWNLIGWSCRACNVRKSDLEDDISAITLSGHAGSGLASADPGLLQEVTRKAQRSVSRRTGGPVGRSTEQLQLHGELGLGRVAITFTAPPQIDDARAFELARLQLAGFFHFLTFREEERRG